MLGHPTRRGTRRRAAIRRFLKRRRLLVALFVLLAMAGAGWGGLWGYRKFKGSRSAYLTQMAMGYLEEGNAGEAQMALDTALRLSPMNATALRTMAQLQSAASQRSEALATWGKLAGTGQMRFDDLTAYAQLAASAGEWALAERLADAVARGGNTTLRHLLRAELANKKNDPEAMEVELRMAVESDKTGNAKAMLAQFLLRRPITSESVIELRGMLKELGGRQDRVGAEALAGAITRGVVPVEEMSQWIAALRAHPAVNPGFLLIADTAELQLTPDRKETILNSVVERMRGKPLQERFAGLQWLTRFGEPAMGAGLISQGEALEQRQVLMAWMDALSMSGNWDAVLGVLSQGEVPLAPHVLKLYRGRTLKALGREDEGAKELEEAYEMTKGTPNDFRQVLAYLCVAGEDGLLQRGLAEALREDSGEALRSLMPSLSMRQDSEFLLNAYRIAKEASPKIASDMTFQNDIDYLSLVVGQPVNEAAISLRSEGNPRDFALRSTQGLSLLLAGKRQEALAYLEACEPDVHVASLVPHQKVIVAAALAANGREKEASAVLSLIPPFSVSRQEVDLVRRFLPQQPAPTAPLPMSGKR